MQKDQTFQTKRLILRPVTAEGAPFLLELMTTPKRIEFISDRDVHTVNDAANYIKEKTYPRFKKFGYGDNMIIRKEDHVNLCTCGL